MKKPKNSRYRLECYEGGIEGLFRYYRARRMMISCLLLPICVGLMQVEHVWGRWMLVVAVLELLVRHKRGMNFMVDLAVYAVGGGLEDKSKRTVALMWEDARHQVAGVFFVAMATASLLAWENFSGKSDVSIRPVTDVLFLYAFIFISSLAIQTPLVDFFAKKIRWWLGAASLMFMSSSLFMLYLFDLGFVARLALTAAPFLLALLALLRWLADDQRRSDLFDLANRCCDFACWWSIIAAIFVWMRPVHLLEIFQQLTEYKPESGMWETFWPLLPFVIASNLGIAFMRKEKIRNGFLHSHPHLMKKESLLPKGFRRQQARACKPLLGSARYWRRVRRVTLLGERPWSAGLLSSLVTAYFLFG